MLADIKHVLHTLIMFQCFFFAGYLLSQESRKRQCNLFLAAFLLAKGIAQLGGVFSYFPELRNLILTNIPHLLNINIPFHLLYVPFLYLYIRSMTDPQFRLRRWNLLHMLPFAMMAILIFVKYHRHGPEMLRLIMAQKYLLTEAQRQIYGWIVDIQFIIYAIASVITLKTYRHGIKGLYSNIEKINLSWLNFVLFGFIGWKALEIIETFVWILFQAECTIYLYITSLLIFLIFVSQIVLRGLKQPELFAGNAPVPSRKKYEKTLLSDEAKEDYKHQLLHYMVREKPHLNPELTLNDLAESLNIPPHHLSQVLNTCMGQNFFDFINGYRIEESKRILSETDDMKKTILEVLYETGFNSKSVFNTAFKKYTGMTPTQFRNNDNA